MTTHASQSVILSVPPISGPGSAPAGDFRGLFAELEASLRCSLKAVLTRNIATLMQLTEEQGCLVKRLEALIPPAGSPEDTGFNQALASASQQVLHLGRVQMALLRRAQRSLRTASNVVAGRQAAYSAQAGSMSIVLDPAQMPAKEF